MHSWSIAVTFLNYMYNNWDYTNQIFRHILILHFNLSIMQLALFIHSYCECDMVEQKKFSELKQIRETLNKGKDNKLISVMF